MRTSAPAGESPVAPERSATRPLYHRRQTCRVCDSGRLELVLSLGPQPLANAFPASPDEFASEKRFPLDTLICSECGLVQIADVVDPEVLFGHYLYVTGTSETIAEHNRRYASTVKELLNLGPRDLVVEVASNDGSLLSCFQALPARTLGIEPASNIAETARARGIDTVNRFFDAALALELRAQHGAARAVVANNVLAHVDDPGDFLRGARELIADDGLVIVEVPYAREMLERLEYDTIYHEHLCYFAVAPLSRLASQVGLRVVRVDRVPVHGGSVRVYFGRGRGDEPAVRALLDEERRAGVTSPEAWERFGRAAEQHSLELRELLERLVREQALLAGYGAPAKGNTLLNFCRIDRELLPFTVDRNPLKVGRYTPGMHIPVLPVESLEASGASHVFILAWNFADEIMRQQRAHTDRGGRWILPIPHPTIL